MFAASVPILSMPIISRSDSVIQRVRNFFALAKKPSPPRFEALPPTTFPSFTAFDRPHPKNASPEAHFAARGIFRVVVIDDALFQIPMFSSGSRRDREARQRPPRDKGWEHRQESHDLRIGQVRCGPRPKMWLFALALGALCSLERDPSVVEDLVEKLARGR